MDDIAEERIIPKDQISGMAGYMLLFYIDYAEILSQGTSTTDIKQIKETIMRELQNSNPELSRGMRQDLRGPLVPPMVAAEEPANMGSDNVEVYAPNPLLVIQTKPFERMPSDEFDKYIKLFYSTYEKDLENIYQNLRIVTDPLLKRANGTYASYNSPKDLVNNVGKSTFVEELCSTFNRCDSNQLTDLKTFISASHVNLKTHYDLIKKFYDENYKDKSVDINYKINNINTNFHLDTMVEGSPHNSIRRFLAKIPISRNKTNGFFVNSHLEKFFTNMSELIKCLNAAIAKNARKGGQYGGVNEKLIKWTAFAAYILLLAKLFKNKRVTELCRKIINYSGANVNLNELDRYLELYIDDHNMDGANPSYGRISAEDSKAIARNYELEQGWGDLNRVGPAPEDWDDVRRGPRQDATAEGWDYRQQEGPAAPRDTIMYERAKAASERIKARDAAARDTEARDTETRDAAVRDAEARDAEARRSRREPQLTFQEDTDISYDVHGITERDDPRREVAEEQDRGNGKKRDLYDYFTSDENIPNLYARAPIAAAAATEPRPAAAAEPRPAAAAEPRPAAEDEPRPAARAPARTQDTVERLLDFNDDSNDSRGVSSATGGKLKKNKRVYNKQKKVTAPKRIYRRKVILTK